MTKFTLFVRFGSRLVSVPLGRCGRLASLLGRLPVVVGGSDGFASWEK